MRALAKLAPDERAALAVLASVPAEWCAVEKIRRTARTPRGTAAEKLRALAEGGRIEKRERGSRAEYRRIPPMLIDGGEALEIAYGRTLIREVRRRRTLAAFLAANPNLPLLSRRVWIDERGIFCILRPRDTEESAYWIPPDRLATCADLGVWLLHMARKGHATPEVSADVVTLFAALHPNAEWVPACSHSDGIHP